MESRVGSMRSLHPLAAGARGAPIPPSAEQVSPVAAEGKLIRRAARGDGEAYRELIERHQKRLFVSAFQVLRNREDAEDVVQEALARSFSSLSSFHGRSSLATWLHRIVFNLAIDLKRRAKRRGGEALTYDDGITPALGMRDGEAGATPEAALRQKEQRERLMAVLDELSDEHRQAIMLREFEGMSYDDIARVSGVSVGTVMSRLFYARKRLQSVLRDVR